MVSRGVSSAPDRSRPVIVVYLVTSSIGLGTSKFIRGLGMLPFYAEVDLLCIYNQCKI